MNSLLHFAPILPGKLDAWKQFVNALLGERRDAYRAAIAEAGLTRLRVWHLRAPDGSAAAVVLFEGPAPERFLERIATGAEAFSSWFRDRLTESHGFDMSAAPPANPELVIDMGATRSEAGG